MLQAMLPNSIKHREQFDGPKSSVVSIFNACPIPSDLVIVRVPAVKISVRALVRDLEFSRGASRGTE